jgi:hypothetical protein
MTMPNNHSLVEKRSLISILGGAMKATWNQTPLPKPEIDADLTKMTAVERIAEVLRYKLLQLEFSISGGGGFRAWLRLNLFLTVSLAIPALLVVPTITWLMGSFVSLIALMLAAAQNLLYTLLTIIAFVTTLLAFAYGLKLVWKMQMNQRTAKRKGR